MAILSKKFKHGDIVYYTLGTDNLEYYFGEVLQLSKIKSYKMKKLFKDILEKSESNSPIVIAVWFEDNTLGWVRENIAKKGSKAMRILFSNE